MCGVSASEVVSQGVTASVRCEACNGGGEMSMSEVLAGGRLRWSRSFSCSRCDRRWEEDGGRPVPDDVRSALLAASQFRLRILPPDVDEVAVMAILRRHLELPLAEARAASASLGTDGLVGTRPEMIDLQDRLAERGVVAEVTEVGR